MGKTQIQIIQEQEVFLNSFKFIKELRKFLDEEGFLEVETPILQPVYGGATAEPFKTHLNAQKLDLYLRISPELYLKRLMIAGFEKVYEIGMQLSFLREQISNLPDGVYCPICHIANTSANKLHTPCPECRKKVIKIWLDLNKVTCYMSNWSSDSIFFHFNLNPLLEGNIQKNKILE